MKAINTKIVYIFIAILASVLVAGCSPKSQQAAADVNTPADTFSLDEVSSHNSSESCWMVVNANVYDVTDYVSRHPGGDTILKGCGVDATEMFKAVSAHEDGKTEALLLQYQIGVLGQ